MKSSCCGSGKSESTQDNLKDTIKDRYGSIARSAGNPATGQCGCCGAAATPDAIGSSIGYSAEEMGSVPEGANLGLGCGNPTALGVIRKGDTVLDLGSGAGFDCFLAAGKVGPSGRVIGVDMTPEMVERARKNAEKGGHANVEFRLGEIEKLPLESNSADVIISNCVINLSQDKPAVFREAFRVLKPGGRLMVSDIVVIGDLPRSVRDSIEAYVGCVAGAETRDRYLGEIEKAGFRNVSVLGESSFPEDIFSNDPAARSILHELDVSGISAKEIIQSVVSIKVMAEK